VKKLRAAGSEKKKKSQRHALKMGGGGPSRRGCGGGGDAGLRYKSGLRGKRTTESVKENRKRQKGPWRDCLGRTAHKLARGKEPRNRSCQG